MTVKTSQLSLSGSPQLLVAGDPTRVHLSFVSFTSTNYIGDNAVSTSTGFLTPAEKVVDIPYPACTGEFYGVGGSIITVLEVTQVV